jgi:hypothetical protein
MLLCANVPENRTCSVCGELINPNASKCNHCGSYQDWTRHITRWSALAAAILGIAPLWGIAGSLIRMAAADKANIEAAIINYDSREMAVAYVNSGKRDGILTNVDFYVLKDGSRVKSNIRIKPNETKVISPNAPPVTVRYSAEIGGEDTKFYTWDKSTPSCYYNLDISWIDFSGETVNHVKRKVPCPE